MLISLCRMTGMPVIWQDEQVGRVERAVMDVSGRRLAGLVVRRGLYGARWAPPGRIEMAGRSCIILNSRPVRLADRSVIQPIRAYLASGEWAGEVTDGVISGETLALFAVEISRGQLARWFGRTMYASRYCLSGGKLIVSSLLSWAQLLGENGEEDDG